MVTNGKIKFDIEILCVTVNITSGEIGMKVGDSIRIEEGDVISARVPRHFVYAEAEGDFTMERARVTVEGPLLYLKGEYAVTEVAFRTRKNCLLICRNRARGIAVLRRHSCMSFDEWLDLLGDPK